MSSASVITARAAVADVDGNYAIRDIDVRWPERDEVLVAIHASGVCHTDWDSLRWKKRFVLGHEGAGVVLAAGPDATSVTPGDPVVLNWAVPCGGCRTCTEGRENICERQSPVVAAANTDGVDGLFNAGHAAGHRTTCDGEPIERSFNLGTLSTHTVVREAAVVRMTKDVPFPSAAILGCGVMTGVGSVLNVAQPAPGSTAVVLGTGGVGLNVVQGLRIAGASRIVAVDVAECRLEMARRFGATDLVLARRDDEGLRGAARDVHALLGSGADHAFECTAVPELGAAPLAMIRNGGTAVQVSGIERSVHIDMELFEWDKTYVNPLYGACRPQRDFPKLLSLYASGDLELDALVTRTYALEDLDQAFDDLLQGRNAKGVIVMDHA